MPGFFVTGTDTEVGKTYVSSLLIQILISHGLKVAAMKPVASGAEMIDGVLKNQDALSLLNAANINVDYKTVNPYVFEPAIAPHLAAANAGVEIDLEVIKASYSKLRELSDLVVVEGAGGWYAPLSMGTTMANMAEELALPVVIIVGLRLGCLNHALLTVQAIKKSGLHIVGWVANHIENNFPFVEENIETLKYFLNDIPFIGTVQYQTVSDQISDIPIQFKHTINKQIIIDLLK